jgi:hypothetical protein
MPTPAQKVFCWHFMIERVMSENPREVSYYDPSYGITADDAAGFTAGAIAGWGAKLTDGELHFKQREAGEHVSLVPR